MAEKRIKDLAGTATTPANDDYLAIDGATNKTRKILASGIPVTASQISDAGAVGRAVLQAGTSPTINNILWEARTGAFTAVSGGRYVATGTFTVTNPASGNNGEMFQVVVASGTVTVNGVAYAASRWPITVARVAGSWTTLANSITENLTLGGNLTVNGNTVIGDASGDSLTITAGSVTASNISNPGATSLLNRQLMPWEALMTQGFIFPCTHNQATTTTASGGTIVNADQRITLNATTTASSAAHVRFAPNVQVNSSYTGSQMSWSYPIGFYLTLASGSFDANNTACVQLGRAQGTTGALLSGKGIGLFKTSISGSAVKFKLIAHDGTSLTESAEFLIAANGDWNYVIVVSNGSGGVSCYLSTSPAIGTRPTLVASISGGPTGAAPGGQNSMFEAFVVNSGTPASGNEAIAIRNPGIFYSITP